MTLCRALEEKRLRLRDLFGTEVGLGRDAFQKAFSKAGLGVAEMSIVWKLASPAGKVRRAQCPFPTILLPLPDPHQLSSPVAANGTVCASS